MGGRATARLVSPSQAPDFSPPRVTTVPPPHTFRLSRLSFFYQYRQTCRHTSGGLASSVITKWCEGDVVGTPVVVSGGVP